MKTTKLLTLMLMLTFALSAAYLTCATPKASLIAEITAQNVGYAIAKENPTEAKKLFDETKQFLSLLTEANSVTTYNAWVKRVLALTAKDPFLRMNFEKLLSLVQVDLKDKPATVKFDTVQQVLNDFLTGVSMGMKP